MNHRPSPTGWLMLFLVMFGGILLLISGLQGATTFDKPQPAGYYGKVPEFGNWTATITPGPNDSNTIFSTATTADENDVFGILYDVTISAVGTDTDFTVTLKNNLGTAIFSKTDCNTVLLPLSYALYTDDADGNNHLGCINAGHLTLDSNDVDPNNLTSITVTCHKWEPRY